MGEPTGPAGGDLLEDLIERDRDIPVRVVGIHFAQVAVVADVISGAILVYVLPLHLISGDFPGFLECFQNGTRVWLASAQVIDFSYTRIAPELIHEAGDVFRVNVIADLLASIAIDFVFASLHAALDEVA